MEIRLDDFGAEVYVEMLKTNAGKLILDGTTTEIRGKSEALEKFLESYGDFVTVLNEYQLVLKKDIQSVSKIISTWVEKDKTLSGQIKGTEAFSGLPEIPQE